MKACRIAIVLVMGLMVAPDVGANPGIEAGVDRLAAEAHRDLKIENQAALERAPGRFLAGRLPARGAVRWVEMAPVSESARAHEEIGAPNRS